MRRRALAAIALLLAGCNVSAPPILSPAIPAKEARPLKERFSHNVRIGWPHGDDWEPYLVADGSGRLYATITHLSGKHLQVQRSDDGGATWTQPVTADPTPTHTGQFDPWMAIDPNDGRTLLLTYMQDDPASQIRIVRSSDLGVNWSAPIAVSGKLHALDKDAMAARGKTIAVCFDNYRTLFAAISTDDGATWTQHTISSFRSSPRQFLCSGAGIDSSGRIFLAWNRSRTKSTPQHPAEEVWIERSSDGGVTWTETHVGYGGAGYPCRRCGAGVFLGSQISLAVGSDDRVYVIWNATPAVSDRVPQRIYFAESSDHGASFSPRQDVSLAPTGTEHSFPTVLAGSAAGDVRIAWEDRRTGVWNLYYRESRNGGGTWSRESVISNDGGYPYQSRAGFDFPYGDYFRMAIDVAGRLHFAWGESPAYRDRGNVWVANELEGI